MIEKLKDLPPGIDGVRAIGKISKKDYEEIFVPLLEEVRHVGRRVRFLYQFGPEFEGFTPGAAWEDAKIGLQNLRVFDGCAVVTDVGWIRDSTRIMGFLMPCPVRIFHNTELGEAIGWLTSLPEGPGISYRLLTDSGVIQIEVQGSLRAQDFDALALAADHWIEAHGSLQGLVIHAREFPGWENFGSLLHHLRFVRDHHQKVRRVALVSDAKLAILAPKIVEHFVQAEIRHFRYEDLDSAVSWAAGLETQGAAASGQPTSG